jgi:hypothetical protein
MARRHLHTHRDNLPLAPISAEKPYRTIPQNATRAISPRAAAQPGPPPLAGAAALPRGAPPRPCRAGGASAPEPVVGGELAGTPGAAAAGVPGQGRAG